MQILVNKPEGTSLTGPRIRGNGQGKIALSHRTT